MCCALGFLPPSRHRCDKITISPQLLDELEKAPGSLERKLNPER